MISRNSEKQSTDQDHPHKPVTIQGMKHTHVLIRRIRRQRRYGRAYQHLPQSRGHREKKGTGHKSHVSIPGKQNGNQRIYAQPCCRHKGHQADGFVNVKMPAKKAENQVDSKLCAEINQNKRSQQRIGDSVLFPKCGKQQGRQAEHGGHCQVCKIAGAFCSFVIWFFHAYHSLFFIFLCPPVFPE